MFAVTKSAREETEVSLEIKALAEVEKIWILYELENDGYLNLPKTTAYLKDVAYPYLTLSDTKLDELFNSID
tara:strand:+ start:93 stop:308 length:216 start_codon:yes stop_codon:yes gene_type:complete